jgi:peptidoglycan/LPS O-acetylase OafA/YrhL
VVDPAPATAPASRHFSFDLLRLGAALAVLLSHSYALVGRIEPGIGAQSVGNIAVLVFFAISGYLIAQSWQREPRLPLFIAKRALRIMPALLAVLVLSAFVLGPLVTTVPLGTYFSSSDTWRYVTDNAVMHTTYDLPGVFGANPFPDVVNGSLWTLKHEVLCYAMIAALGVFGLLRRRGVATVVLLAMIAVFAVARSDGPAFFYESSLERAFCVAALLCVWQDAIPRSRVAAVALVVAWVAAADTAAGVWLAITAIPYATIVAAGALPAAVERPLRGVDVSYGVYLWAFPVQQLIVQVAGVDQPAVLSAIALPLTVACALASWFLVEHPALRLKSRVTGRLRGRRARPDEVAAPVPARA